MKIVGIFPVKTNNERVPGKNTRKFYDGTPLIYFVQKNLLSIDEIDENYCYCSNENIKEYLLSGVELKKRSKELDTKETTSNDILMRISKEIYADIYVYAMATAPFLKAESIRKGIEAVRSGKFDSAMPVEVMHDYLWKGPHPLNFDVRNVPRSQDLEPIYKETCGFFVVNRNVICDNGRRVGDLPYLVEVGAIEAIDIDYPDDFMIADAVYKSLKNNEK